MQHTLTSMINNKWITLYLKNPLKTYNKVKEIFKPLTCKIDFGKLQQVGGFPVYTNHVSKILDIRVFDVQWKDKFNSPRHEHNPCINITLFRRWKMLITWNFIDFNGEDHSMEYWETILSWMYYDKDLNMSIKESTGWYKFENGNKIYNEYELLRRNWQFMYEMGDLPSLKYNKYEKHF